MQATFVALFAAIAAVTAQTPGCTPVSVVADATYCIKGPICSGSGLVPAGNKCPVKGDVASASCLPYLKSHSNGKCIAPVDGVCEKIPSGAWGCVWPKATTARPNTTAPSNSTARPNTTAVITLPVTTTRAPNATTRAPNATNVTTTKAP